MNPITARRVEMGYRSMFAAAKAAGVNAGVWRNMEHGRTLPRDRNLRQITQLLCWSEDSLRRVSEGLEPVETEPVVIDELDELLGMVRAIRRQLVIVEEAIVAQRRR